MGLVVVAPAPAASAQTQHFTVDMFWGSPAPSSSVPAEVLSTFSFSTTGPPPGKLSMSATATMPVNDESASVLLDEFLKGTNEPNVCVAFYPAATSVTTKPFFYYSFKVVFITSYVLQDEAGTGASVQITLSFRGVAVIYPLAGKTPTPTAALAG
jgi:type VI protein secretion system component Hcp